MTSVRSADGTEIAIDRFGSGPAVVMVDAAGAYRDFNSLRPLGELLAAEFTVYTYDRRGRGLSTDTAPYAVEREIEDLAAVIEEAGGSAYAYGLSSGALLILQAAASGAPISKLALFEPPLGSEEGDEKTLAEFEALIAAGRRADTVNLFLDQIGVPAEVRTGVTELIEPVAHTLPYDWRIGLTTTYDHVRSVQAPTLVIDSEGSSDNLTGWAANIAKELPNGAHRSLQGEWHNVPIEDLAPVVTDFFTPPRTGSPSRAQ